MNDTLERTDWWVYTEMKSTCNTLNPPTWFMQFITLNSFTSWHTQYLSEEPMVAHAAMTSVALMLCVCVLELFVMRLTGFVCLTYICLRTYPGRISILLLDIPTSVVLFTRWVIRTPNRPWTVEAVCVTFWDKTSHAHTCPPLCGSVYHQHWLYFCSPQQRWWIVTHPSLKLPWAPGSFRRCVGQSVTVAYSPALHAGHKCTYDAHTCSFP